MKLDLKPVFAQEGSVFPFRTSLDLSGFEFARGQYPFRSPVLVDGRVENRAGVVTLSCTAEFDYFTECDRCLKDITEHYRFPLANILVRGQTGDNGGELLPVPDDAVDLDEYVRSGVILNLPTRHLCKSDCRGLCPRCGKNLNEGPCACGAKQQE